MKVERVTDAVPGLPYPILIDGTGRCPPEDVGGSWGHADFLDAIADPDHERNAELTEWVGGAFDPLAFDMNAHAKAVDALARKWSWLTDVPEQIVSGPIKAHELTWNWANQAISDAPAVAAQTPEPGTGFQPKANPVGATPLTANPDCCLLNKLEITPTPFPPHPRRRRHSLRPTLPN